MPQSPSEGQGGRGQLQATSGVEPRQETTGQDEDQGRRQARIQGTLQVFPDLSARAGELFHPDTSVRRRTNEEGKTDRGRDREVLGTERVQETSHQA